MEDTDVAELKKGSRVTGGDRDKLAADLKRKYESGQSIRQCKITRPTADSRRGCLARHARNRRFR